MSKWSANEDGVVLGGYDVVAYLEQSEAVRGSAQHSVEHDGVSFWFSSPAHAQLFADSPHTYLPSFGGFCAFAVAAKGALAPADPATFKIRDGELLLFFNDYYEGQPFNTAPMWNKDEQNMYTMAKENWTRLAGA